MASSTYIDIGGEFIAGNQYLENEPFVTSGLYWYMEGHAARSVTDAQLFPLDAIVERAAFEIQATAPGVNVRFSDVDEITVRSGEALTSGKSAVVVDFHGLTTVKNLNPGLGAALHGVYVWTGTDWQDKGTSPGEFASEKVLMEFDTDALSIVSDSGSATLPASPGNVEMLLDGVVVWTSRQGGEIIDGGWRIDKTDLVRQTVARLKESAAAGENAVSMRLELRSDALADLELVPSVDISRVHRVVFSNGPSRNLPTAGEGPLSLDLPLPEVSTTWEVDLVKLRAAGSVGPERTQPAVGPEFTNAAKLCLSPGRTVLLRLPDVLVTRFDTIGGIRVPVVADGGTGELGGQLLGTDRAGNPVEPIAGASLTPVSVPSGDTPSWTTLSLPEPLDVSTGPFWVELIVSYGELVCPLTHATETDPAAPGAPVRRRLPGGGSTPLTQFPAEEVAELFGALRVVGEANPNSPIDALTLNLEHPTTGEIDDTVAVGGTPTADGVSMHLQMPTPAVPAAPALHLVGSTAMAGDFTFDQIDVIYREEETP